MSIFSSKSISYPAGGTAKRTALGSLATLLGNLIRALEHVILIPLFLMAWGNALYGEWLTLFSFVGYLSLSELGMGNYIINKMTQAFSVGRLDEYARIFKNALYLYAGLAVFGVGLVLLVTFGFPISDWFNVSITSKSTVRLTVLILSGYMLFGILSSPIHGLYSSVGEFVRGRIVLSIRELLLLGFVVLTLLRGGGFVGVASWYLVLLVVFLGFSFWDATRRHKEINLSEASWDWKLTKSFVVPGLIFMLIPLADMITIQGTVLLVSSVLGSAAVAVFVVHRTLSNLISRITTVIQPALHPEIAVYEKRENFSKVRLMHNVFLKISLLLSISAVAFLAFTGRDIINIWTGGKIIFHPALWFVLLAIVPITSLWRFSSTFQMATNKYNTFAKVRLIFTVVGILLAIILIKPFGLTGVVLGIFVGELVMAVWFVPKETLRIIDEDKSKFFKTLFMALPMFAIQLVLAFVVSLLVSNIWLKSVIVGILVFVVGISYTYYLWVDEEERSVLDQFIRKIKAKS